MSEAKPPFTVVIPPPLWALLFVLLAWGMSLVAGLGPEPWLDHFGDGALVFIVGFALALWGRLTFARVGTEVRPASPTNSHLVTGGPFAFTRNPMYVGILIGVVGLTLMIGTVTMLAAPVVFFLWVNFVSVPYEEAKMERQFGDTYRAYKSRVRRWI